MRSPLISGLWRVGTLLLLALLPFPGTGTAQEAGGFDVDIQVAAAWTRLGLYRGDATVGSVSVAGWSVSLGLWTTRHIGGEVFYSFSPNDDDPYDRAPGLRMIGGMVMAGVSRTPHEGFDLYGGLGVTHLKVRAWPDFAGCRIEDGCFREGGPSFTNGGAMAPLAGAGISHAWSRILVRLDFRIVGANDQAEQATTVMGIGIGVVPF